MDTILNPLGTTIAATVWAVSIHLLIGGLLWTAAARSAKTRRFAHNLRRTWPVACFAASGSALTWWLLGEPLGRLLEPAGWIVPGAFTLSGSIATSGCFLVLHAARLEARGALRPAREQVRAGGKSAFLAADLMLVLLLASTVFVLITQRDSPVPIDGRAVARILIGATGVGGGGVVALLAGLTGKPRPSGYFAAAFYLIGMALLVGAADPR
jgi:hypothetical protein